MTKFYGLQEKPESSKAIFHKALGALGSRLKWHTAGRAAAISRRHYKGRTGKSRAKMVWACW